MKTIVPIVVLLTFLLINCKSQNHIQIKTEYEPIAGVSIPMEQEEIKYWDSLCTAETKRAKIDINNGKLVYTHLLGMIEMYRSNTEMDSLLAKYSISTAEDAYFCTVPWGKQNCYGKEMENEISKRYGIKFIDSLRQIAENTFVHKHRNDIFKFEDCDMTSRYYGTDDYSEFIDNYKRDFFKEFKYPANFKYKNEQYYSYSNADFILHKDGSISNLEISSTFQNPENEKFRKEIEKQIEKFVRNAKWKPATARGILVNSEMKLTFHYK
ncbi:hypothetical protein PG614_09965 [Riemerella anatipestifer]|nr:hypothetical protein [Riemerella anatipestifer]MDY3534226.1 hypothetical protein [Riemerella anatipestifer]MDY3536271.1 hypothetical protein [Riemerella anatipestifer]